METAPSRVTGFCFIGSSVWSGSGSFGPWRGVWENVSTCDLSGRVENWGTARETRTAAGSGCFGTGFIQTRVRFNRAAEDDLVWKQIILLSSARKIKCSLSTEGMCFSISRIARTWWNVQLTQFHSFPSFYFSLINLKCFIHIILYKKSRWCWLNIIFCNLLSDV